MNRFLDRQKNRAMAAQERAFSQLVMQELARDYGAAEQAADEAEAAAAVAEFAASMPPLPRAPPTANGAQETQLLNAPRGETAQAEISAIDARLPACADAAGRSAGALGALREESRAADERFASEKAAFVQQQIDGFVRLRDVYRECQQGRASLKLASRLMEPRIAEAELVAGELRERRQQLLHPTVAAAQTAAALEAGGATTPPDPAASLKRKRRSDPAEDGEGAAAEAAGAPLAARSPNARADAASTGKRRRWSRSSSSGGRSADQNATTEDRETCIIS